MKHTLFISAFLCIALLSMFENAAAQNERSGKKRDLLSGRYSQEEVRGVLLSKDRYHPFPKAGERKQWNEVPEEIRRNYIKKGERALDYAWPSLTVNDYLDYFRSGSREKYSAPYSERRQKVLDLVLAECMEGKGRFTSKLADGIWLICEETSWVPPFHIVYQKAGAGLPDINEGYVDLLSAETGSLLAWTYYLLGEKLDAVSPLIKNRMASEVKRRITDLCLMRDDFWWMWTPGKEDWSHTINNWVPWICSNWLASVLLTEEDEELRSKGVYRIMQTLDRFINSYPDDGGCDEGPSYWEHAGGSLFESLELLAGATENKIDIFGSPLICDMGRYIYRAYISGEYYINTGDAAAKIKINTDLVLRYGLKIKDENLAGLGAAAAVKQGTYTAGMSGSLMRQLAYLFSLKQTMKQKPGEPFISDVYLPDTKIMAAREKENSGEGFYVAVSAGHNGKSHNHNDTGNFILYADGEPVVVDAGLGTYTAKTFSTDRYTIWTMQSAYHNLPQINGVMQKEGREYAAKDHIYSSCPDSVVFSADIAGAYPEEAKIDNWIRTIKLNRKKGNVEISESYSAAQAPWALSLSLMTPCEVSIPGKNIMVLKTAGTTTEKKHADIILSYDSEKITPQVETISLDDKRLKNVWGETLRHIILKVNAPAAGSGNLKISFGR